MADTPFGITRSGETSLALARRALTRDSALHSTLVLYLQLWADAEAQVPNRTATELAALLDVSVSGIRRSLRILKRLDLLAGGRRGAQFQLELSVAPSERAQWLCGSLATGALRVDRVTGELWFGEQRVEAGVTGDTSGVMGDTSGVTGDTSSEPAEPPTRAEQLELSGPVAMGSASGAAEGSAAEPCGSSESVQKSGYIVVNNTSIELTTYKTRERVQGEGILESPKRTAKRRASGLDRKNPVSDPHWADVTAVQEYANQLFGVSHSLVNTAGQLIGQRAWVIHRALVTWEHSVADLKLALEQAAKDPWWKARRINDTTTLFRKDEQIQRWLEAAKGGHSLKDPAAKWDKKQPGLSAGGARPDPTKIVEEFV